jgi:hypothetical protein
MINKFAALSLIMLLAIASFSIASTLPEQAKTDISPQLSLMDDEVSAPATVVYITKTGKKYHRSSCRYLKKSKIKISLKDAKKNKYAPCKVCKPPTK